MYSRDISPLVDSHSRARVMRDTLTMTRMQYTTRIRLSVSRRETISPSCDKRKIIFFRFRRANASENGFSLRIRVKPIFIFSRARARTRAMKKNVQRKAIVRGATRRSLITVKYSRGEQLAPVPFPPARPSRNCILYNVSSTRNCSLSRMSCLHVGCYDGRAGRRGESTYTAGERCSPSPRG